MLSKQKKIQRDGVNLPCQHQHLHLAIPASFAHLEIMIIHIFIWIDLDFNQTVFVIFMLYVLVLKIIECGDECEIYFSSYLYLYLYDEDKCEIYFQAGRVALEIPASEGNFGQYGVSFWKVYGSILFDNMGNFVDNKGQI